MVEYLTLSSTSKHDDHLVNIFWNISVLDLHLKKCECVSLESLYKRDKSRKFNLKECNFYEKVLSILCQMFIIRTMSRHSYLYMHGIGSALLEVCLYVHNILPGGTFQVIEPAWDSEGVHI